jgi:GT2 family glycosyltransferase
MPKSLKNNPTPTLAIIILNYNSRDYLVKCLQSLDSSVLRQPVEIIIVDNASTDDSFKLVSPANFVFKNSYLQKPKYLPLKTNLGFAAGNNRGLDLISSPNIPYVLFLNPDTTVEPHTLQTMIDHFNHDPQLMAATCHVTLALTGQLQPECHRGFPTPWNTFWHFFGLGIPRIFPKSALFHGYLMDHLDYSQVQPIDCCVGAFFMLRRQAGNQVGWWNEKYFFYGEDLDFCYKLHQAGHQLYFFPDARIVHYQGISSGIIGKTSKISTSSRQTRIRSAQASTTAMAIFFEDHLAPQYPLPLRLLVRTGIKLLENYRHFKAKYL